MKFKTLLNNKFMMFLLVLPFLEPSGTEEMGTYLGGFWSYLHLGFFSLKWISFLVITLVYISRKFSSLSKITVLLTLYQLWIIAVTVIKGGMTISRLSTCFTAIGAALLCEYYMKHGNTIKFLSVIEKILAFWIIMNFLSIVAYPNGMYTNNRLWAQNWILGYKNLHIYCFLPFLTIGAVSQYIKHKRLSIKYYAMIVLIVLSALLSRSATTVAAVSIFAVLTLFCGTWKLPEKLNMMPVYVLSLALSIGIIFFGIQDRFSNILLTVFGRDATFSARTLIWARAMIDLAKSPVIGNGLISYSDVYRNIVMSQMHNMYLDALVIGGIVLLAILTWIVVHVNQRFKECNVYLLKNLVLFSFAAYSVLFIMEARRDMALLYMFFTVVAYLPEIEKKYNLPKEYKRLFRFKAISRN